MKALLSATDVDIILIDTPPALVMTDAFDIGLQTGAAMVLVVQASKTAQADALEVKQRCAYLNLELQGVILNQVRMDGRAYQAYYARRTS